MNNETIKTECWKATAINGQFFPPKQKGCFMSYGQLDILSNLYKNNRSEEVIKKYVQSQFPQSVIGVVKLRTSKINNPSVFGLDKNDKAELELFAIEKVDLEMGYVCLQNNI